MAVSIKKELDSVKAAVANGKGVQEDLAIEEQQLTVEKLRHFLPKDSKVNVNQATVDMVNELIDDSGVHRGLMEERLLTYTHLLGPGVGMKQLLKAIQFVILSTTPGMTQTKAYMITFPEKATELIAKGQDGSSFASMYAQTKLPREIMMNVQVGPSVTYAPLTHQLVEKLMQLSNGKAANGENCSPTVQLNATLGLLDYIKVPEDMTINLKHGVDEEAKDVQRDLADKIGNMAALMQQRMAQGESISAVQKIGIKTESIEDAEIVDGAN